MEIPTIHSMGGSYDAVPWYAIGIKRCGKNASSSINKGELTMVHGLFSIECIPRKTFPFFN